MDIKPTGLQSGTYSQPGAEGVESSEIAQSSTTKFSVNPSRFVSSLPLGSEPELKPLSAIDTNFKARRTGTPVSSRCVSHSSSDDEMESDLNTVPDYDFSLWNKHLNAIRPIKPACKPFPKSLSTEPVAEQFAKHTIHWLQLVNTPYAKRDSVKTRFYHQVDNRNFRVEENKRLGVFYPKDYRDHELPALSKSCRFGFHSLPEYFDTKHVLSFVSKDNGHKPSECLNAFFHGPTTADCATTLFACQYRAIETIIGSSEFDRIFGAPVSKFRIPANLFGHISQSSGLCALKGKYIDPINLSNPLYRLFNYLEFCTDSWSTEQSEQEIEKGDILYIEGVKDYHLKHASGSAVGFNLVCTGQNSSGQNLYLGFGPNEFYEPKTYDQVKKILIDGYNKPQSPETILAIKEGKTNYTERASDTVPYDHPIGGITITARFNTDLWDLFLFQCDQVWHRQPLLSVTTTMKPKPVYQGSKFHTENLDADIDQFEHRSTQQELMYETARKFTHAVIHNQGEASKPMGLFLTGSPGLGKTHLCVAVTKKAADYGLNTLYLDADKAGDLYQCFQGNEWDSKIEGMLAGKDLVVIDDANGGYFSNQLLAKTMKHVIAENKAIMVSSNHHIPVKAASPDYIDPITGYAQNFLYLSDLQGDGYRSQWWHSPEVQAADALSQLAQYQGRNAAGVITEQAVSIDETAKVLGIPAKQIRQVGHPYLPGKAVVSQDYHFSHLSKTEHQAVFMECNVTRDSAHITQFLNVIQKVHDEGLKLVVKTNDRLLLLKRVLNFLQLDRNKEIRIRERLEHMFPDFAESGQQKLEPDRE
ncbi:ATP-binding protein [Endozoicomonas sp. 4G]|uniref:DnaA ATPase domain-containing protein n=1 Tax=Endozoicomonas sp. 4G TaxID=2872754 RepID=UPI002078AA5C|nr:ATP-binding protein [Endozoicomonas sp. 4G]